MDIIENCRKMTSGFDIAKRNCMYWCLALTAPHNYIMQHYITRHITPHSTKVVGTTRNYIVT